MCGLDLIDRQGISRCGFSKVFLAVHGIGGQ
jgi:hypothetical protein